MKTETSTKKPPLCPTCFKAELQPAVRTEQFEYPADGKVLTIVAENVPVRLCPACGDSLSGPVAGRIRDEAICKALGLLTPTEIRALREQLGLSQAELAKLTGISETSIARWERGQAIQDRGLDRYLRLIGANPVNVRQLEQIGAAAANGPLQTPRQESASVG